MFNEEGPVQKDCLLKDYALLTMKETRQEGDDNISPLMRKLRKAVLELDRPGRFAACGAQDLSGNDLRPCLHKRRRLPNDWAGGLEEREPIRIAISWCVHLQTMAVFVAATKESSVHQARNDATPMRQQKQPQPQRRTTRVEEETVAKRRRVGPWWRPGCTHISTDDEVEKECMKTPTCAANCTDSSKPTARKGSTA